MPFIGNRMNRRRRVYKRRHSRRYPILRTRGNGNRSGRVFIRWHSPVSEKTLWMCSGKLVPNYGTRFGAHLRRTAENLRSLLPGSWMSSICSGMTSRTWPRPPSPKHFFSEKRFSLTSSTRYRHCCEKDARLKIYI